MQPQQKLEGTVESLIYENEQNGYSVFEVRAGSACVVVAGKVGAVRVGQEISAVGRMEVNPSYGEQFTAEFCQVRAPTEEKGILTYLSGGALPYIGPATAKKMVEMFGGDTLRVIAEEPERLTRIRGLSEEKVRRIHREFHRMFGIQEAVAWLGQFGIGTAQSMAVCRHYGEHTLEMLTHNPYLLCAEPLYLKFSAADEIASRQQIGQEDAIRVREGILYEMRHCADQGHTCVPRGPLIETIARFIRVQPELADARLTDLLEDGRLNSRHFDGKEYIFLPDLLRAEEDIAELLTMRSHYAPAPPRGLDRKLDALEISLGLQYAPMQRQAIHMAMENQVLAVTGGPGTGKTTVMNAVLALCQEMGERVALCAPTGRAAKRLSEITGCKATTIHRLLEVDYSSGTVRFIHNKKNLLPCSVLILDEISMVDVKLLQSLLLALRPSCRIIMVGDAAQLPSVGPGNVLGEILESGVVPAVCLTEIFRQAGASLIVRSADAIRRGEMVRGGGKKDDFFLLERRGPACAALVCELVCRRLPAAYGFDPVQDIQVLTPTKTGSAGTGELNRRLQQALNPPQPGRGELRWGERVFRLGDKVMQVRNNYDLVYEREDGESGAGVYNGDIGIIVYVDAAHQALQVKMDDRLVTYDRESLSDLEMAYAVTIHKSQGNEFPAVVIAADNVPRKLCYRNLIYTAVTRARRLCVVAGSADVVHSMIQNTRQSRRFSCLARLLRGEQE